jgi:hypothetical protein
LSKRDQRVQAARNFLAGQGPVRQLETVQSGRWLGKPSQRQVALKTRLPRVETVRCFERRHRSAKLAQAKTGQTEVEVVQRAVGPELNRIVQVLGSATGVGRAQGPTEMSFG